MNIFKYAFIINDKNHQMGEIQVLRKHKPVVVLCNATKDRHTDHAKASDLVSHACFLSGLKRIETIDCKGSKQAAYRPHHVFHYIQWDELVPDFVVNISGFLDQKMHTILSFFDIPLNMTERRRSWLETSNTPPLTSS